MTILPIDYTKKRATVDGMMRRWGARAVLRRTIEGVTVDRPCIALITNYNPQERAGKMIDPTYRKALISALAPDGSELDPPSRELDVLVTFVPGSNPPAEYEKLKIAAPPDKVSPTGVIVYWSCSVKR